MAHCNRNDSSWQTGIVAHSHWIGGSFECRLFIYSYFCENNSKLTKFDYVGDWLSKFVTGIITGLLNVSIYAGVIEKFIYKNNAIIDVAIMMVMVIVFICGTISIFVIFGKKHKYKKLCAVVVFVTVMVMIIGILHEINPLNKEKTADEFIKIKNEEYVILSKVDDKVLVVPFEFDKGGKCHLLTSQYSFKNKYEGTYYYIDLNQYPIIKK